MDTWKLIAAESPESPLIALLVSLGAGGGLLAPPRLLRDFRLEDRDEGWDAIRRWMEKVQLIDGEGEGKQWDALVFTRNMVSICGESIRREVNMCSRFYAFLQ